MFILLNKVINTKLRTTVTKCTQCYLCLGKGLYILIDLMLFNIDTYSFYILYIPSLNYSIDNLAQYFSEFQLRQIHGLIS